MTARTVRVRRRDQLDVFEHRGSARFGCPYCGTLLFTVAGVRCPCGAVIEAVVERGGNKRIHVAVADPPREREQALAGFYGLYLRRVLGFAPDEALAAVRARYPRLGR